MPTTVTATVHLFQLAELSDRAREKAIEAYQDCNVDWQDWHDPVLEMAEEQLTAQGILSPVIQYSGFWSQGDGASFTGSVDLPVWLRSQKIAGKYRALYNSATAGETSADIIRGRHYYCHEYTAYARVTIEYYPDNPQQCERLDEQANAVQEILEEWRYSRSQDIYSDLRKEYEYLTSPEAIAETIEANEWQFTEDGTPEHRAHLSDYYQ